LRELGRGGTGTVFLVRDTYLERDLALKLFHEPPWNEEEASRVEREFKLLSRIEHPGIAKAYDFGSLDGRPYFTSEYVPGEAPGGRGTSRDPRELLLIFLEVAGAVAFLHENGILHLDIKPSNIVVAESRGRKRGVLIDFGLSRRGLPEAPAEKLRGSLPYMAPEHFREGALGPWTDVYALGVTFYRLATGAFPRPLAAEGRGTKDPWSDLPRPPSSLNRALPRDLDHVLLKCLAVDPRSRFSTAGELAGSLRRIPGLEPPEGAAVVEPPGMVGRGQERETFDRFVNRLRHGPSGPIALLVTGAPGMGQSLFLRAMKARAQTGGFQCCLLEGYRGGAGAPGSLLRALRHYIPQTRARSRWESFLSNVGKPRRAARTEATEAERRVRRAAEVALAARALKGPLLLMVDGLQHFDEISAGLVADLVRALDEDSSKERPVAGVVVGYREEGPSLPLLKELTGWFLKKAGYEAITLNALDLRGALELYQRRKKARAASSPPSDTDHDGLSLLERTGGCPGRIVALADGGGFQKDSKATGRPARARSSPPGASSPAAMSPIAVSPEERGTLAVLHAFGRPATAGEISRIERVSPPRARRALKALQEKNLAFEEEPVTGPRRWMATMTAGACLETTSHARLREAHGRIASEWLRERIALDDPRIVEVARHLKLAGRAGLALQQGIAAVRYLKSTFQNRAALDLAASLLRDATPQARRSHPEIVLEKAWLHTRLGDFDEGIRCLQDLLTRSRGVSRETRLRALLQLATLHARRGDFRRADALFREGLAEARGAPSAMNKEEVLFFIDEHAAVKGFLGDPGESLRLCEEGLSLAGRSQRHEVREVSLSFLATRAHVALRSFDFASAERDFQKALAAAEAMGSRANQAAILSNLGILYSQCDRYSEAIRVFLEAERTGLALDEGPSLASIYGNLAVLYAKRGEFDAMEGAIKNGMALARGGAGQRQKLFLEHSRGLSSMYQGRYREAQAYLEEAIRLGEAMGDRQVAVFDQVYRAEALLFRGKYAEAAQALERLSSAGSSGRAGGMALARLALLEALTGRVDRIEATCKRHQHLASSHPVPFLDAWDKVFLGWSLSLGGFFEKSQGLLESAEDFFHRHGLLPAVSLAVWIRAEGQLLRQDHEKAAETLKRSAGAGNDLTRVLYPLLEARIFLDERPGRGAESAAADLLAGAGSALVGNELPEWELRLAALRAALLGELNRERPRLEAERRGLVRELPEEARKAYLKCRHWKAWQPRPAPGSPPEKSTEKSTEKSAGPAPRARTSHPAREETARLRPSGSVAPRTALVARSLSMRRLLETLERLRGVDLPVLIQGETGSGKELIARTIHAESVRARRAFRIIDCAAVPPGLLEAELFGAKSGAFTGIQKDRPGLLKQGDRGTILLDEIAGVDLGVQAKLLRVLSEGVIRPLGGEEELKIDARFLFSTSRDLESEIAAGLFRGDLFYRIAVVSIRVPPLRERVEDLPELVASFLEGAPEAGRGGGPRMRPSRMRPTQMRPTMEAGVMDRLKKHPWPGNVRELFNLLSRLVLEDPRRITLENVDRSLRDSTTTTLFPRNLLAQESLPALHDRLERDYIVHHYQRLEGDADSLCGFLRLSRRQLYRRCERLGISLRREKKKLRT
jgi:DNA-binding NtrC family response regulator/tetratricopeptide (TPR) repeat protein